MDQSYINTIINGVLPIFGILVGIGISHLLQSKDAEKKIKLSRIDKIEELETANFFDLKEIMSQLVDFRSNICSAQDVSNRIASVQNKLQLISAMAKVLSRDDFNKLLFVFEQKFADFSSSINCVLQNRDGKNVNSIFDHLGTVYEEFQEPFIRIIEKLDKIRMSVISTSEYRN